MIKLKDIADKLGVSCQAVSLVLNQKGAGRVSAEKIKLIQDTAYAMGYSTNVSAQVMRKSITRTAAVLVSSTLSDNDYIINRLVIDLIGIYGAQEYSSIYKVLTADVKTNVATIREMLSRGVHYFTFIGQPFGDNELFEIIRNAGCVLVEFDTSSKNSFCSGFKQAITRLWSGFSQEERDHFVYFSAGTTHNSRACALRDVMTEELYQQHSFSMPLDQYDLSDDFDRTLCRMGYDATCTYFKDHPETRVLFYHSDYYMLGGIKYFVENNFRIGQDVKLIGVNNIPAIVNNPFPLISLGYDKAEVAEILYHAAVGPKSSKLVLEAKIFYNDVYIKLPHPHHNQG